MMSSAIWQEVWTASLVNHLWQSTLVVLIAWLLTLALRNNQARYRYWIWMIASIKFLIPFSLLIAAGHALRPAVSAPIQRPALAAVMQQVAQPYPQSSGFGSIDFAGEAPFAAAEHYDLLPLLVAGVWLCGFLAIIASWVRSWRHLRTALRGSPWVNSFSGVPVLSSPHPVEPGVFGIFRPVLLLPENIGECLSEPQLAAILAHEVSHVRRRDNLTAAIHMAVQALFWFHPAVWWIKARLLEERERACDEAVLQSGNDAELYAESILNVCKFYVESPLVCMSGVTGSNLKRRIVRIMTERVSRRLDVTRKVLLGMAALAVIAAPIVAGLVHVAQIQAQAVPANPAQGIADTWQGTLHAGSDLRIVLKISKAADGGYTAINYSIDQGGAPIPVSKITLDGTTVKMLIPAVGGTYEGKLSPDGKTISGNWSQGPNPLPLNFARATPETEWTIPTPPPPLPPMDANANPSFEVATIKPSKPDDQRKAFLVRGRRFQIINQSLTSILSFAYGVQAKQLIGLPPWADTDKYDIDAEPDGEGAPSDKQWRGMLQKLIVERYKFTFHREKKELSVYALSVAKGGPKLPKSDGDPNGLPGLFFRGLGDLNVRNANMGDFCGLMQNVVLDRPVVDQSGLTGRFDFTLKWTPDDSQFGGAAAHTPPSTDANPPPNLYTAIQEQIGLKLEATKAPADVLIIDHVEKPSDN